MMTSPSKTAVALRREIHNFYWGIWSELGVSGWVRTHQDWAIDPEPLIVFSPSVIASEPRMRDEVLDWCIHNWRHVSAIRLRHLLQDNQSERTDEWGEFAATVNHFSGSAKWPHPTDERNYTITGRSALRSLSERSMIYLRMRSIFGLSARTEVLRHLLATGDRLTAAMLATETNYAKRNVAEACDSLTEAGILKSRQLGNRLYFSLVEKSALARFVGSMPQTFPDWPTLLRIVNSLFRWSELDQDADERVLTVEAHRMFGDIRGDIESLALGAPRYVAGAQFLPFWRDWSTTMMKSLATGEYPVETGKAEIEQRPLKRSTSSSSRKVS